MARISDILVGKGSVVHTIDQSASVLDATRLMNARKIGALVIFDESGQVVGIFTERDVLRRVVAEQRDPATTPVSKVMTADMICGRPDTDLGEVQTIMKQERIRHLPIMDESGHLHGLISIGDVNAYFARDSAVEAHFLHEYFCGRT